MAAPGGGTFALTRPRHRPATDLYRSPHGPPLRPPPRRSGASEELAAFQIEPGEWITPKPLAESTIALITTAGLHRRDDVPFASGAVDYRIIPGDVDFADVISSHLSSNWDRSALAQDLNVVLPIERLRELAEAGEIGGVARWHYSFMGGIPRAHRLEPYAREVARLLKRDGVDAAVLVPV